MRCTRATYLEPAARSPRHGGSASSPQRRLLAVSPCSGTPRCGD